MKITYFLLALMIFTHSCNDDNDTQQNSEPTLNATWSLVNVTGGFAGVNDDFESGIITWHFNNEPSEITVSNNDTSNAIHTGYVSGTYNYEVVTTPNDTTIVIENTDLRIISLTTNQLILDEGMVSDGFQYTFYR